MAERFVDGDGVDLPLEVPEPDLLEQQIPVEPDPVDDQSGDRDAGDYSADMEADDADRWEQQQSVPLVEDDYPLDPGQAE